MFLGSKMEWEHEVQRMLMPKTSMMTPSDILWKLSVVPRCMFLRKDEEQEPRTPLNWLLEDSIYK